MTQTHYHIAQVNVARMRAALDDPTMRDFVDQLDEINALADRSPGFVWRLQTGDGNATAVRAYDDGMILFNMSVWRSLEELKDYVYRGDHAGVMRRRREWFEKFEALYYALWWVPAGHTPTIEEARQRMEHLQAHGESEHAFSYRHTFPAPGTQAARQEAAPASCPAWAV